jgi:hypothetical protein
LILRLDADGNFAQTTALVGTYDMEIKMAPFLVRKFQGVTLGQGPVTLPIHLWSGDIDQDNVVSILDYIALSSFYERDSTQAGWADDIDGIRPVDCDLDKDGTISIIDYLVLSGSYDLSGD